jgi:predicted nucleic acid-binding protein
MNHFILDACALVNLRCGWGALNELQNFGASWSIGDTALREALFVRDFDPNGDPIKVTLNPESVVADGNLQVLSLDGEKENTSFVEFALELDDGEAQAMSLALHRGFVLLTDDRPAVRVASGLTTVQTMGTPEVLIAWVNANPAQRPRLPEIIRRVTVLGPFQLKKTSPHYTWWQALLAETN